MKTLMLNKATVEKKWYIIDAEGKALGRVAAEAATLLRGKHKATFTPNVDCGDYVIILNCDKLVLSVSSGTVFFHYQPPFIRFYFSVHSSALNFYR